MNYILHYDMAAIVLAFIVLIHFYHKKSIKTPQTHIFEWLLWLSAITGVLDIVTVIMDRWRMAPALVYTANIVYLDAFNLIPFLYYFYLFSVAKKKENWQIWEKLVLYMPVTWIILLISTSPFTKLIFYYNIGEGYSYGAGYNLIYVSTAVYMLASLVIVLRYRANLTRWQRMSVYFYLFASVLTIVLKIVLPYVLIVQFTVALSILLLYMSLENPDDDEDKMLGIFNRRGFDKMISAMTGRADPFHVIVITITNVQPVREVAGVEFSQAMMKQLANRLCAAVKPVELFYLAEGRFAVIVDSRQVALSKVIRGLQRELAETMVVGDMNILPESILLQVDYPDEVRTVEDIMDSIDYSAGVPFESSDGEVFHNSGEILKSKRRESRVLQIMQQALKDGSFQVYYQPIYSTKEQRFNSAEALIRLVDEELGFISPDEFIPMAEKNGMILKIGEFVFRTVCAMMAREKIWEKGIDYIEVNLSVVQCMQEDICEMLYGIMDEYDIPYSCINLEVTETTLARDILWNTMERMTVGGVTFSLDDYGTGYSNLSNVLKYPFHIVKLDKSMVWYAMENEDAMRALRHTVSMIQDLDMHIVAEGVETEEQLIILKEMGCEYLQGYYFSRPVPESDFLTKIS